MSIIDTFDNKSEEVIKPSIIAAPVEEFPNTVIITFRPEMIDILKDMCEIREISQMPAVIPIPVYKFTYKGHELGIYVTVPCSPATTALMVEVFVKRAENVLLFGACGVLDKRSTAGHIIILKPHCGSAELFSSAQEPGSGYSMGA